MLEVVFFCDFSHGLRHAAACDRNTDLKVSVCVIGAYLATRGMKVNVKEVSESIEKNLESVVVLYGCCAE